MALVKLNHGLVGELLARKFIRPTDMAKKLGVSKQMGNYILHTGGLKYARKLAKILGCEVNSLLLNVPSKAKHK